MYVSVTDGVKTFVDDRNGNMVGNLGVPYPRAAVEAPEGILLIDTSSPNEPKVRRLEIGRNTNNLTIVPTPISDALDLSIHAFDYAVAYRWGDYEIICCQEYVNGV